MSRGPITALVPRDARSLVRDPLLFFLLAYASVLALVARFGAPYIPIGGIELYLAPAVVIIATMLGGVVLGMSLVEERETETWLLFRVLPAGGVTFSTYLVTATALIALVSAALSAALGGVAVAGVAATGDERDKGGEAGDEIADAHIPSRDRMPVRREKTRAS